MVLGLRNKTNNNNSYRRSSVVHIDYIVHVNEIKPWPPSQSLRSLRAVLIQWESGDHRCTGSTNAVVPSIGSIIGEGKIDFNESFKVPVTLLRDMSAKPADGDVFQRNCLELNLYESRRDKTVKGQSLATAIIDFSEYGMLKERLSFSVPMNCKRSFRNTDQPVLYVTIQCVDKAQMSSSSKESLSRVMSMDNNGGGESVSALMNEEYAEEAETGSFTDDDVSSHSSSLAASSNGGLNNRSEENWSNKQTHDGPSKLQQTSPRESLKRSSSQPSSLDLSSDLGSPQNKSFESSGVRVPTIKNENAEDGSNSKMVSNGIEHLGEQVLENIDTIRSEAMKGARESERSSPDGNSQEYGSSVEKAKKMDREFSDEDTVSDGGSDGSKEAIKEREDKQNIDGTRKSRDDESFVAEDVTRRQSFGSDTSSGLGIGEHTPKAERLKPIRSVRADSGRNGLGSVNQHTNVKEINVQTQNGLSSLRLRERKDSKVFPRDTRSAILESKLQQLEHRIKMLEGELTEAAAVEASLYSVVAEHGSSGSKVHAPARRLARMYLHACKETSLSRRANAATSAVSGLVLVAKACGNDVPRLTFWLSNSVVLRTILNQAAVKLEQLSTGSVNSTNTRRVMDNGFSPLKWKISPSGKREGIEPLNSKSSDWEQPQVFICALEKIEAWIFSRIVESIWWQTLTPHMHSIDSKEIDKEIDSESVKSYNRSSSSGGLEQGSFSLYLWKKAFRDSFERLCPVRAAGHECGCLPMLARLVMEQSVSRLDVAMFNAILRESGDDIPTDPVSDPISDSRVLPIPAGTSSFEAGAQLKNAIGNWSRWLTDIFGIDDDESLEELNGHKNSDERQETSFKSFHFLNALSDLMMLPKDMLLNKSIRKEVCPKFGAPLIKRVLDNFVPDEFCPDPIPNAVFEALESEDLTEEDNSASNFPCDAAGIVYCPPSDASIASIIGVIGSQANLRRSGSSILRKSYTSDDELDELNSPLALILNDGPRSSPVSTSARSGWISKEKNNQIAVRYELLRDVWMESEI